jgi:hypothetical protein
MALLRAHRGIAYDFNALKTAVIPAFAGMTDIVAWKNFGQALFPMRAASMPLPRAGEDMMHKNGPRFRRPFP